METPRRRALGKGLEELFSAEVLDFDSLEEKIVEETPKEEIKSKSKTGGCSFNNVWFTC